MLVDELTQLLPADPGRAGMLIAIFGLFAGVVAWLGGSRFSRPVVTLLTVALGTMLGLYVPRFFGWSFSGPAPAVAAALMLGVTGYILHFLWVGVGLGLFVAIWAAIGCWIKLHHDAAMSYPAWTVAQGPIGFLAAMWHGLPTDVTHVLPLVIASALICGVAFAILWPKASLMLGWSLAGATMLTMTSLAVMRFGQPKLLTKLNSPLWAQVATLLLLVAIGTATNWWISPRAAAGKAAGGKGGKGGAKKSSPRDEEDDD